MINEPFKNYCCKHSTTINLTQILAKVVYLNRKKTIVLICRGAFGKKFVGRAASGIPNMNTTMD